ncbi:MAG TPA: winged helix-turn-helix domain-containing protein [Streptosporangiaceae bacterium]|nr:winged helix-turn-helix domain-containing protein [Streptosporangiaceae bacterium]
MVTRGTPKPPSRQLADLLRAKIESGELAPGTPIPSIVALATEHQVATNTVQKALRILKDEGLITSVPGYGTFVAER